MRWPGLLAVLSTGVQAYNLEVNSRDSLKKTAKSMAEDMMSMYTGDKPGGVPGLLGDPYYWWEGGALMGSLVDYWYYTGDDRFNRVARDGLLFQVGPNADYMPPNQTMTEGNDDQGFWGMAAMTAAEYKFPDPPADQPQWLALAQAVFNTQAARWDAKECGGGLRWQIFTWNKGYNYKNSISQACFFNVAARLALYTGNETYADWAGRTWDWMTHTGLIDPHSFAIVDGLHVENCAELAPYQWSYNVGAFLLGAAAMYNHTESEAWRRRVDGLLDRSRIFFKDGVMSESTCESAGLCNTDQKSFKAYLSRWLAATTKWAPWTYDRVKPLLASSASAAAAQCSGGGSGRLCGLTWTGHGKFDGSTGVGQQMAAMEVVLANMVGDADAPVTNTTGGTSGGDAAAGGSDVGRTDPHVHKPVTAGDRAGAAILTLLALAGLLGGMGFVLAEGNEPWGELRGAWGGAMAGVGAVVGGKKEKEGREETGGADPSRDSRLPVQEPKPAYRQSTTSSESGAHLVGANRDLRRV